MFDMQFNDESYPNEENQLQCSRPKDGVSHFDRVWSQRYLELVEFKKLTGHCNVLQRYALNKRLGKWVHKQRVELKKRLAGQSTTLSAKRFSLLTQIDFQLVICKRTDDVWYARFCELINYGKKEGHYNVPQNYVENKALGKWVHRQKHELKKKINGSPSHLTSERFLALMQVGFVS